MRISAKLGIGVALVAAGLAGLVYTMPIISNELSSEGPVYREADVPAYSSSMTPFIAVEITSAAVLTGGIVLCALGYTDRFVDSVISPNKDKDKTDSSSNKEKTQAASGA